MKNQLSDWKKFFCLLIMVGSLVGCSSPAADSSQDVKSINERKPVVHTVEMKQMKFIPAILTVNKGDTIIFVNHDILVHDVTEEMNKSWSSSPLKTNASWKLTATESVNYFCSIHPVMKGNIVVEL